MPDAHANFAYSLVTVAPSPAVSGLSLTVANGSIFPAVPFNAVVCPVGVLPLAANAEIVRVTANAAGVLTILRAQEGTSARTILVGDSCFAAITAKTLTDAEAIPNPISTTVNVTPADALDSSALVLRGSSSPDITPFVPSPTGWLGKEHIMRVYKRDGTLVWDIDANGIMDTTGFTVQNPPDQGGGPGSASISMSPSLMQITTANSTTGFKVQDSAFQPLLQAWCLASSSGCRVSISPDAAGVQALLQMFTAAAQSANMIEIYDNSFSNVLFRLDKKARPVTAVHTAPADADLATGECAMWYDQTPAATKVMFKAKDSAGTVKTGSVTLT